MKYFWIPESPKWPGIYAPSDYKAKIKTMTRNPWEAMRFDSKGECSQWCTDNPYPIFNPVEHGFEEEDPQ